MLINRAKTLAQIVTSTQALNSLKFESRGVHKIIPINKFTFSKWNRERAMQQLIIEINEYEVKKLKKSTRSIEYFNKLGWQVTYDSQNTLFTYNKVDEQYQYRALTQTKFNPPNDPNCPNTHKNNQNPATKKLNIAHIIIFVKKRNQKRWMVGQFGVIPGSVELMNIFFQNIEPSLSWQKNTYPGPELSTLPKELVDAVNSIFINANMTTQLVMNMVIYSSIVVHEIDEKWHKNIKDFWL